MNERPLAPTAAAALAFGAAATITQALVVREFLSVAAGAELSLGVVFASWLTAVGIGGWLSGRTRAGRDALPFLLPAISLAIPAQLAAVRCARLVAGVEPGLLMPPHAVAWTALAFTFPVPLLVGITFPCLCRAWGGPGAVGRAYICEAAGSALGGAAFTFALAGRLATIPAGATAGIALCAGALALAFSVPRRRRLLRTAAPCAGLALHCLIMSSPSLLEAPTSRVRWASIAGQMPLLGEADTRYQHVSVGGWPSQTAVYGNGHLLYTAPDPYADAAAVLPALCQHPRPVAVLILGGSPGLPRATSADPTVRTVTRVTLDAELPAVVQRYAPVAGAPDHDPRVQTVYADGRRFLKSTEERFDVILVCVGDPTTAPANRYYTAEFVRLAKTRLAEGGVLGTAVSSAADYIGPEAAAYAASAWRTLQREFAHVAILPGQTTRIFASETDTVRESAGDLAARYEARGIRSDYFDATLFETLVPPGRSDFARSQMRQAPPLPPNTDARPLTYYLAALLWSRMSEGASAPARVAAAVIEFLLHHAAAWHLLAIPAAVLAWGLARRGDRTATAAVWTTAATGTCGMSLSITLLLTFQNLYGYLYAEVGLLVGVFMLGLGMGGAVASLKLKRTMPALMISTGALVALSLLASLSHLFAAWGIALGLGGAGFLVGTVFPLAARLLQESGAGLGRAAGAVEAADHIGAAAGALLTGAVLFPLFGAPRTCLVMAAWLASALVLLAAAHGRDRPA